MRGKQPGTITLLKMAIERKTAVLESLEGDDNPQVVVMCHELRSEIETYQIVLDALRGNKTLLRIQAGL